MRASNDSFVSKLVSTIQSLLAQTTTRENSLYMKTVQLIALCRARNPFWWLGTSQCLETPSPGHTNFTRFCSIDRLFWHLHIYVGMREKDLGLLVIVEPSGWEKLNCPVNDLGAPMRKLGSSFSNSGSPLNFVDVAVRYHHSLFHSTMVIWAWQATC